LTFGAEYGYNIRCRSVGAGFTAFCALDVNGRTYIFSGGHKTCSELINPKSATERWSTVFAREWRTPTAEKYLKEDAQKAEPDSLIKE
jgi:hypothetical protein